MAGAFYAPVYFFLECLCRKSRSHRITKAAARTPPTALGDGLVSMKGKSPRDMPISTPARTATTTQNTTALFFIRDFLSSFFFSFIITKSARAVTSFARFIIKKSPPFL